MLLKWQCYLVQQYRRHGKYFVIFGLCLTINFLGHMIICGTNLSDGSLTHRNVHHNIYASLRSSASPKERRAFLVITILTGPVNFDRRKAIRETWLSSLPKDVQYYFMIGTKELPSEDRAALEYEQHQYKDLILLTNFKDSYYSLTSKVVSTFQWLDEHVDFQYVFKADDDTFARVDMISGELMKRLVAERFYWGFFDGRARVKKTGQWAEKNWILCDTYLPHARGGGYVLSRDLVQYISVNAEMLKQFNSEDISVGAWLGPLDIERKHDPRFDTEYRSRGCNNAYIVTHKQEVKDMREKFDLLQTGNKLCAKEFRTRNSYIYNWNVYPSSCCIRDDPSIP